MMVKWLLSLAQTVFGLYLVSFKGNEGRKEGTVDFSLLPGQDQLFPKSSDSTQDRGNKLDPRL